MIDQVIYQTIQAQNWSRIETELACFGFSVIPKLLSETVCKEIASWYEEQERFRSKVIMHRHGFGQGEYQYFNYPLPNLLATLRTSLYPFLVPTANHWNELMGLATRYPLDHKEFINHCHEAGQIKPTPLLVQYGPGDYNCLHQDLYGEHVFPLQGVVLLADPKKDFTGGELVLTEQRPRMQSKVEVIPFSQGDLAIFTVQYRPVKGTRGNYRVNIRHGVSKVRSGLRHTLGIIFHDAS
jgi:hypothetical protein